MSHLALLLPTAKKRGSNTKWDIFLLSIEFVGECESAFTPPMTLL